MSNTLAFTLKKTAIQNLALAAHAIDHPNRKRIFDYILKNPGSTPTDVEDKFGLRQDVTAQMLGYLRRSKLLLTERNGKNVKYYVNEVLISQINEAFGEN